MKKIIAVIIAAMLVLAGFSGCASEEAEKESSVALKIGNAEYTEEEVNYIYVATFNEIYNYYYSAYGEYISTLVDVTVPLEEQTVDGTRSWHEYLLDATVNTLTQITGINEKATEAGFVLPEEYQKDLDTFEEQLETIAAEAGMTGKEYIETSYGKDVSVETVKSMTGLQIYCNAFLQDYVSKIEVSDEEIASYYEANKKDIDTVDFRYYSSIYASEGEEALTKEEAEAQANAIAAVHTADEFNALAKEYTTDEEQKKLFDEKDATLFPGATYASTGIEEVSEWLFDDARVQGDTMIYHDEAYSNFLTVMFEERIDPAYNYIDVRHILIAPEEDAEGNSSDEAWTAAEAKATEILDGYLAGEMTEEAFGELAKEHSADGNAAQGGIYENVRKGQMVQTFNDWCFDEARVSGDTGIVKTQFGYHIMYFVGTGDNNLATVVKPLVEEEKYNAFMAECTEGLTAEPTEAFENCGGMIDEIFAGLSASVNGGASAETEKETKSFTGIIIGVLVAIIIVCIVVIIKNGKGKKTETAEEVSEEAEESVLEATDEDLTEEELLAEEAFEENPSEEAAEEVTEEEASEE